MADEKTKVDEEALEDEDVVEEDVVEEEEGAKGKGTTKTENDKSKTDKPGKTFTQAQVTRMMTREKNQGRAAVLKELGIDPKDTKAVAMVKAIIDSQKTDEDKEAEKANAEAAKVAEAEERAMKAEAKTEAMLLGVKPQYVEDVVALALSKMTDDADLKTIIGEFKTKYSIWFGEEEEDEKSKVGQKGTGSSVKTKDGSKKDGETKGLGARLAAQRKGTAKKTSYWS